MLVFAVLIVNISSIMLNNQILTSSHSNNSRSIALDTSRGIFYDRNMKKLVNSHSESITVCLPTTDALKAVSPYLTEENQKKIYENMTNYKVSTLKTDKAFDETNIKTTIITSRYSTNQPCVHIIGHLDENGNGANALERAYNDYLTLQKGEIRAIWSVDAQGRILLGNGIEFESDNYLSPAGIQLTIDLRIQRIAENLLLQNNITQGAIVVLNSDTSEILACASVPEFNPLNLGEALNNEDSPFINRGFTPYSIGSVFKPIVAISALESNIEIQHTCTGSIEIGGTVFSCSNNTAHGNVDMKSAMEQSCNTYFIALGQMVGSEKILSICSALGIDKDFEIADNYFVKSGTLPQTSSVNSPAALANISFGQGELLASPIHMATAYASIINGGYYREPIIVKGIIDKNGNTIQKAKINDGYKIFNSDTASKISLILRSVVTNGNGYRANSQLVDTYGKTATAQSGWFDNGREINHTWFCGYFTINKVNYVAVIFKEDGISGALDCAPVFKELAEIVYNEMV